MKKLNISKETFNKSKYFVDKYGKLEYVSESGKLFKTSKGQILKFKEKSSIAQESLDMDDVYDKAWYEITLVNEDGEVESKEIDVTDESDWGNINTIDGTCFFPSGDEFDGIGWGDDEDGYQKITKVVDLNTNKRVPLTKWAKFVESLIELFN